MPRLDLQLANPVKSERKTNHETLLSALPRRGLRAWAGISRQQGSRPRLGAAMGRPKPIAARLCRLGSLIPFPSPKLEPPSAALFFAPSTAPEAPHRACQALNRIGRRVSPDARSASLKTGHAPSAYLPTQSLSPCPIYRIGLMLSLSAMKQGKPLKSQGKSAF